MCDVIPSAILNYLLEQCLPHSQSDVCVCAWFQNDMMTKIISVNSRSSTIKAKKNEKKCERTHLLSWLTIVLYHFDATLQHYDWVARVLPLADCANVWSECVCVYMHRSCVTINCKIDNNKNPISRFHSISESPLNHLKCVTCSSNRIYSSWYCVNLTFIQVDERIACACAMAIYAWLKFTAAIEAVRQSQESVSLNATES